jgi:REP element-mobilizing transposase RayT
VHVVARGLERGALVRDDHDRHALLGDLAHAVARYQWLCHAYCLMDNHYHLLLETPLGNLPLGMRHLNGVYAQRFNRRHGRFGYLFQSRYRSILVEQESHLLIACRYLALNPVKAGMVERPEHYPWGSHRATAGLESAPAFLTTDWILAQFGTNRPQAQAAYLAFVADAADELTVAGERLGTDEFLTLQLGQPQALPEVPRAQLQPLRRPLDDILATEPTPILSACRDHGYRLHEIADHLGRHYSTVSRALRREEELLQCKT